MSEEYNEWYWKLYRWFLWDVKHVHKTVWIGIKNLWRWFPIIWKDRDWDYYYIFQVLKFKLEKQAKHLNKYGSERDAELMMTCVRLINKLQNEEYYEAYYDSKPMNNEMMHKCQAQHNKAKHLLFHILNERIDSWWD